jgi:hypothetical protein
VSGSRPKRKTNRYDTAIKEMMVHNFLALLRWLVPEVAAAKVLQLPAELPATARQVDLLVRVRCKRPDSGQRQPPDKILIVEFQVQRDPKLHRRMLLRAALAHEIYGSQVQTLVLALAAAAVVPQDYVYGLGPDQQSLVHRVTVRHLFAEPAEAALATELKALLPLVPAMKPKDGDHAALLRRVVEQILRLALPGYERAQLLEQAAQFARLRLPRRKINGIVSEVTRRHRIMLDPLRDFPMLRETYRKAKAEGKVEGKAEGKAESVVMILQARGVPLSRALRQRILACVDPAMLDRWLRTAVSADSAADLFGTA